MNEPKWFRINKTIMEYTIQYTTSKGLKWEMLALLNQVRIHIRIFLPCELVGFSSNKITKEMRENEARSYTE